MSGFRDGMHKMYVCISLGGNIRLRLLWLFMHLIASICYFVHGLVNALESFLISSGLFNRYKNLDISKVQYLAVVIDSEEAHETMKVLELLQWLADIGFKKVCLYDKEGLLKKSKEALALWSKTKGMSKKLQHYLNADEKPQLTELDMADALKAIGYRTLEPDLMLIYGAARCHLGFPAWRSRYTEMVHMGPLKSMKVGAIIKAVHRHTPQCIKTMAHRPLYTSSGNFSYTIYKISIFVAAKPPSYIQLFWICIVLCRST